MKKIYFKIITLFFFVGGMLFNNTYAANITWTGGGDGTTWSQAANWGGTEPGTGDNAVFGVGANVTVTGTPSNVVKGIWLFDNATVNLDLDLTLSHTASNPVRVFDGSVLTVKTTRTLTATTTAGGALGYRKSNGTFIVEAGATANLTGIKGIDSQAAATTGCVLINSGILNVNGSTAAIQPNGATDLDITNNQCGIIDAQDAILKIWGSGCLLTNNGLIKYSGAATTAIVSVTTGNVATNNAFFTSGSGNFASGSGTSNDNGVNVGSTVALDAGGGCTVDINGGNTGMQAYTWAFDGSDIASNAADGTLDVTGADFPNATGPHTITVSDANCITNSFSVPVTVENVCAAAVLPVELINFTAEQKDQTNLLKWRTATEINNAYFEVQSSVNGRDFETLEIIEGNGTTFEISDYEFIDEEPSPATYYRLLQVDYDGYSELSKTVFVERDGVSNEDLRLFPMPVNDVLSVRYNGSEEEEMTVSIMDITGRILSNKVVMTDDGENQFELDFSNYPAGSYFIRLQLSNDQIIKRVINQ